MVMILPCLVTLTHVIPRKQQNHLNHFTLQLKIRGILCSSFRFRFLKMFAITRNTEQGLACATLEEFIACWRSKQEADFSLQFREGKVRLNFSYSLGDPDKTHVDPSPRKRIRRTNLFVPLPNLVSKRKVKERKE